MFLALAQKSGKELTHLSIVSRNLLAVSNDAIGSLKSPSRLEHLEMDDRLFFGDKTPLVGIGDILPPSIKTVRLLIWSFGTNVETLQSLFAPDDLLHQKLPLLEGVRVVRGVNMGDSSHSLPVPDEIARKALGEMVRAAGFRYEEEDAVGAPSPVWLEGLESQYGPW
ncbi:uncharacterized protein LTR77_006009 [Saxophila tyrrhenica]|uniref:Uncharacterized protein n=1 Tax=Saxophila tyrrhenica TaxID=1690608 RepID=A0AAV9PAZ0_9PEZI|nr:hypothetical protein LTR77_006009 [Saxophila tyrrhenica]